MSARTARITLTVLGAAVVVSVLALIAVDQVPGQDLADYPSWLEALSTFAAFAAATIAVWFAAGAFRLEAHREESREEEQRSAQAAKISAWLGHETRQSTMFKDSAMVSRYTIHGIKLRNASDTPVYRLVAVVKRGTEVVITEEVVTLPPSEAPMLVRFSDHRGRIADEPEAPLVEISFTDAAGVRWRRSTYGQLTRTPN